MTTSEKVKSCLESHDFIPDDHETELTPDEICGAFMEHVTSIDEKSCSLPLLNILPLQIKSNIDEVIKKETKTNQPSLWCAMDEGILSQAFLVVDKKVFIELSKLSYFNSLLVLMGAYFAFNLSYDRRQELIFQFVEEFVLGLRPSKKSVRYSTLCMLLVPEK
ncbi:uncharacterized protein [Montipora capricornis]|uniref:uncharacterized protein n=1 Tax=Montipora capricornis TaxID=246305 RepID=UPI0035F1540C